MESSNNEYKEILTLVFRNKEAIAIFNIQLNELIQKHNDIQIIVKEMKNDQLQTVQNFNSQTNQMKEQRLEAFISSIVVTLKYISTVIIGIIGYFAMKFCDKYLF